MSREAFEKWLIDQMGLQGTWDSERNCYKEFSCHIAYKAWQAALESQAIQPQVPDKRMLAAGEMALRATFSHGDDDRMAATIAVDAVYRSMLAASQEQPK